MAMAMAMAQTSVRAAPDGSEGREQMFGTEAIFKVNGPYRLRITAR